MLRRARGILWSVATVLLISSFFPIWMVEWAGQRETTSYFGTAWEALAAPADPDSYASAASLLDHYAINLVVLLLVLLTGGLIGFVARWFVGWRTRRRAPNAIAGSSPGQR